MKKKKHECVCLLQTTNDDADFTKLKDIKRWNKQ